MLHYSVVRNNEIKTCIKLPQRLLVYVAVHNQAISITTKIFEGRQFLVQYSA
jgi:hypothetical protein